MMKYIQTFEQFTGTPVSKGVQIQRAYEEDERRKEDLEMEKLKEEIEDAEEEENDDEK